MCTGVWDSRVELEVSFHNSLGFLAAGHATSLEATAIDEFCQMYGFWAIFKGCNIQTQNFLAGRECHFKDTYAAEIRFILWNRHCNKASMWHKLIGACVLLEPYSSLIHILSFVRSRFMALMVTAVSLHLQQRLAYCRCLFF